MAPSLIMNLMNTCRFPVESMVLHVTSDRGAVVSQINANNLLKSESHVTDLIM